MARKNTCWGAFDVSLNDELERHVKKMKEMGIKKPLKMDASIIIAEKSKRCQMTPSEIKRLMRKRRGLL